MRFIKFIVFNSVGRGPAAAGRRCCLEGRGGFSPVVLLFVSPVPKSVSSQLRDLLSISLKGNLLKEKLTVCFLKLLT